MAVVVTPLAVIVTGDPPLVAEIANDAFASLVVVGVNVKSRLQLAPAANVDVQLVMEANGEDTEPKVSVMADVVEFDSTVPYVGDVVPTVTVPKLCPLVVRETPPEFVPEPVSVPPFDGV
jgi:hypothetical protein